MCCYEREVVLTCVLLSITIPTRPYLFPSQHRSGGEWIECKFYDQLAGIFGSERSAADSISTETQPMAVDEADVGPEKGFCPTFLKYRILCEVYSSGITGIILVLINTITSQSNAKLCILYYLKNVYIFILCCTLQPHRITSVSFPASKT